MFLMALLLGGVLGVVYDVFRISRLALRLGWLSILLEDILFFLLAALLLFRYFLELSAGQIRWFALVGMLLGWIIYYFSLGVLVMRLSQRIIDGIRWLCAWIWHMVSIPLLKTQTFAKKCWTKAAKPLVYQKNRLKSSSTMLYNKCVRNATTKHGKGGRVGWRQKNKKKKKGTHPSTPSSR